MKRRMGLILVCGCLMGLATASYGNLVNPGFDGDGSAPSSEGWTLFGADPSVSGLLTRSAPGAALMYAGWCNYAGVFQSLPASPGELWQADVWTRNIIGDSLKGKTIKGGMNIEFYDASDNRIGLSEKIILDGSDPNLVENEWVKGTTQLTAPAGTVRAVLSLYVTRTDGNDWAAICYDDASLEVVPEPTTLALLAAGGLALLRRRKA